MHNYFIQILNYATIFDKDNLQCKFPAMVYTFNIKLDLKHKHLAQLLFVNMNMASMDLQSLMERFATRKGTFCPGTNFVNQIIAHLTSEIITKIHKYFFM